GRCMVSECEAPLWLVSGATTQTSLLSVRAMRSSTRSPGALMPSSLVTRMRARLTEAPGAARSAMGRQALEAAHVGTDRGRQHHAAVGLLKILEDRDQSAAHGEARAVQGVHEAGLPLVLGAKTRAHAPRLEVAAVGAAGDLAIAPLPRQPDLDVVGLARGEAGVAAGEHHDPVRQLQPAQDLLGARGHALVLGLGLLGPHDADQLDLGELVLADHALGVLTGGARL